MNKTLIYVHDPMCSWCWGFERVRNELFARVDSSVKIERFVGGLAPDSDEPMPQAMQNMLKATWQKIEQSVPGTVFNFDFWTLCKPRRSTYPSNRAVIAARLQGKNYDESITLLIQQAYYSQAENPSDDALLLSLGTKLSETSDFNYERFADDFKSSQVDELFKKELNYIRSLGVNSFPSLVYQTGTNFYSIALDYNNADNMLNQIKQIDAIS